MKKLILLLLVFTPVVFAETLAPIKVMLLTGVSDVKYHDWKLTSSALKKHLDDAGVFDVDYVICPDDAEGKKRFDPNWEKYNVIVMAYNDGNWAKQKKDRSEWSDTTKKNFERFVRKGGGLVVQHSTNNGFPDWLPFNKMTAVGGWGGRKADEGVAIAWRDGKIFHRHFESRPRHPPRGDFWVTVRDKKHPITRGLPETWQQIHDEVYTSLRGPAKNVKILATAYSDPTLPKGSGDHEPMLMTIKYHKGRVFHLTLGHASTGDKEPVPSLNSKGFILSLQRGTEWAATGDVIRLER